ncbi:Uncharacterized protein SCF082_LOCUS4261 [Durusdinium trenchii]
MRSRKRHESSQSHNQALRAESLDQLESCNGLILSSETGRKTLLGVEEGHVPKYVELWLNSGCIAVISSILDSVHVSRTPQNEILVRDASCLQEPAPGLSCVRGYSCCKQCLTAANKPKIVAAIKEWALKIAHVDLLHITLQENQEEQAQQADFMKKLFPELRHEQLHSITYADLIVKVRGMFLHIPMGKQNAGLQSFISRSLKFLTPKMFAGVPPQVKCQLSTYVDALTSGKLDSQESVALDLISKGALRADDVCKALVPALLRKADRIRRGHCQRTGGQEGNLEGLLSLGFVLGGALQNAEVQKTFGISRAHARKAACPLTSEFLPRFFAAAGDVLVDSISTALGLLRRDDPIHRYMMIRDEVVYAVSYNLMYGLDPNDASLGIVVGGVHPEFAMIEGSTTGLSLGKDNLARIHACTLVKNIDCRDGGFQVQHLPKKRVSGDELKELSEMLHAAAAANGDVPPLCFAIVHDFLLGLVPRSEFEELPFFEHCFAKSLPFRVPHFPFKVMCYKTDEAPLFGCCDPKHVMKAWARALRSSSRNLKM